MAKIQTRRSISISRELYNRATEAAAIIGVPLSQLTEFGLREALEVAHGIRPAAILARNTRP